jgi:hypothetical protein
MLLKTGRQYYNLLAQKQTFQRRKKRFFKAVSIRELIFLKKWEKWRNQQKKKVFWPLQNF